VAATKYISIDNLKKDVLENGKDYTEWFKIVLEQVLQYVENNNANLYKF